jgi:hypothetical protein
MTGPIEREIEVIRADIVRLMSELRRRRRNLATFQQRLGRFKTPIIAGAVAVALLSATGGIALARRRRHRQRRFTARVGHMAQGMARWASQRQARGAGMVASQLAIGLGQRVLCLATATAAARVVKRVAARCVQRKS